MNRCQKFQQEENMAEVIVGTAFIISIKFVALFI